MTTTNTKTLKISHTTDINVGTYPSNAIAHIYDTKLTLSGKRIEVQKFARPMLKRHIKLRKAPPQPIADRMKNYKRRTDNRVRARRKLTQLVHQNIPVIPHAKLKPRFYLLTYADQKRGVFTNHKQHMQDLERFVRKLRTRHPGVQIQYMGAKEKTKKGQAHFHILFTGLPFIDKELLEQLWGQGFVKIKALNYGYENIKHVANYISKYITKDGEFLGMYQKLYFVSENLEQPLITTRPETIIKIMKEAIEKKYLITKTNKTYQLEFINNAVNYEVWEPV